ncbi:hypothetical protein [Helicobacter mesocricetorum]|uniref:hypothetical protein n=1 Tax=Helicobacter mesocricetorum TaxID=87012 RepID=UPI000CF17BF3|nr:hypothetical protein [Helicobacter mesocricetorum]
MQKIYLVSFGDTRLGISICRFKQQAESLGVFDNIFIYTEASLPLEFMEDFKERIYTINAKGERLSTRGFGYWCWKPKVILMALEQIKEGDLLIYCDIGCEFEAKNRDSLLDMLKDLDNNEMLGLVMGHLEKVWNKADLLKHFNLLDNEEFLNSGQCAAGIVFLKKTPKTIQIIKEWLEVFKTHFHLVDDSPSKIPNLPEFKENRHDQSIYSILNKRYKIKNYPYAMFANPKEPLQYNRNKIYLPNNIKETKALNEFLRGKNLTFKEIQECNNGIFQSIKTLKTQTQTLQFHLNYGTASSRLKSHLAYKLGEAMILNSKSLWGTIRMPYVLSCIKDKHYKEQKQYQEKIKKNPKLKLPPLESYSDYKESLKIKTTLSYKLGEALITANSVRGGGKYLLTLHSSKKCVG